MANTIKKIERKASQPVVGEMVIAAIIGALVAIMFVGWEVALVSAVLAFFIFELSRFAFEYETIREYREPVL